MRNFQDTFEIRKRPFISVYSVCMTVPLIYISLNPEEATRGVILKKVF